MLLMLLLLLEITLRRRIIVVDLWISTRLVVVIDVIIALEHTLIGCRWGTGIVHEHVSAL
jgi:hypothetical protein